ncbi:MAG: hypothetical protein H0T53_07145 [Herpetosiphonaceae bacterium]|nr:hypothetical protein [Herpetosiphonaceae bacterium]
MHAVSFLLRRLSVVRKAWLALLLLAVLPNLAAAGAAQPPLAPAAQTGAMAIQAYLPLITSGDSVYVESSVVREVNRGGLRPGTQLGDAVIRTTLPITIYDVLLEMRLYNADTGEQLKAITTTLDLPAIYPGQPATAGGIFSYSYWFDEDNYTVEVDILEWQTERLDETGQAQTIVPLTIVQVVYSALGPYGWSIYEATIRNDTPYPISEGWFVIRGPGGKDMKRDILPALEPGASTTVYVWQWQPLDSYVAAAQGRLGPAPASQR